jgi:hypothetical protein
MVADSGVGKRGKDCGNLKIRQFDNWKNGRMEEWKNGKMEEWKNGRMEKWKNGKLGEKNLMLWKE